jgi:hypothetical protein
VRITFRLILGKLVVRMGGGWNWSIIVPVTDFSISV